MSGAWTHLNISFAHWFRPPLLIGGREFESRAQIALQGVRIKPDIACPDKTNGVWL